MKKTKHLLFLCILSLFCLNKVNASCTEEELNEFKAIEDKYTATYQYDTSTNNHVIIIKSLDTNKYELVLSINESANCEYIEETDVIKCTNVESGQHQMEVLGTTDTCNDTLKSIKIKVPKKNPYYNDPLCEGIEEFVLCRPTYDKEIDRTTFESRIATYKKSKLNSQNSSEENSKDSIKENKILNYIKNNITQLIIITVFIILVIITIILTTKKIKESRRLE